MSDENGGVDKKLIVTLKITRKEHSHPAAYTLVHKATKNVYVGSTENLYTRMTQHKAYLQTNQHRNKNLQKAFDQSPVFDLNFVRTETREQALDIEQQIIDDLKHSERLLNISMDSRVSGKCVARSPESNELNRQRTIAQFADPTAREKHGDITRKMWADPKYREKQRIAAISLDREKISTKISTTVKRMWDDPLYREQQMSSRAKSRRPITIDGVEYESITAAALQTNTPETTIASRLSRNDPRYWYSNEES